MQESFKPNNCNCQPDEKQLRIASFKSNWQIDLRPNTVDANTKELKIGLRRIYNYQSEYKYFVITVKDPENNVKRIKGELQGYKWVYVTDTQDFKTAKPGIYTIIWEVNEWDYTNFNFESILQNLNIELYNPVEPSIFSSNLDVIKITLPQFSSPKDGTIVKIDGNLISLKQYSPKFLTCHQFEITNDKNE